MLCAALPTSSVSARVPVWMTSDHALSAPTPSRSWLRGLVETRSPTAAPLTALRSRLMASESAGIPLTVHASSLCAISIGAPPAAVMVNAVAVSCCRRCNAWASSPPLLTAPPRRVSVTRSQATTMAARTSVMRRRVDSLIRFSQSWVAGAEAEAFAGTGAGAAGAESAPARAAPANAPANASASAPVPYLTPVPPSLPTSGSRAVAGRRCARVRRARGSPACRSGCPISAPCCRTRSRR